MLRKIKTITKFCCQFPYCECWHVQHCLFEAVQWPGQQDSCGHCGQAPDNEQFFLIFYHWPVAIFENQIIILLGALFWHFTVRWVLSVVSVARTMVTAVSAVQCQGCESQHQATLVPHSGPLVPGTLHMVTWAELATVSSFRSCEQFICRCQQHTNLNILYCFNMHILNINHKNKPLHFIPSFVQHFCH